MVSKCEYITGPCVLIFVFTAHTVKYIDRTKGCTVQWRNMAKTILPHLWLYNISIYKFLSLIEITWYDSQIRVLGKNHFPGGWMPHTYWETCFSHPTREGDSNCFISDSTRDKVNITLWYHFTFKDRWGLAITCLFFFLTANFLCIWRSCPDHSFDSGDIQ